MHIWVPLPHFWICSAHSSIPSGGRGKSSMKPPVAMEMFMQQVMAKTWNRGSTPTQPASRGKLPPPTIQALPLRALLTRL